MAYSVLIMMLDMSLHKPFYLHGATYPRAACISTTKCTIAAIISYSGKHQRRKQHYGSKLR
jgi:hypothetical protein